MSEPTPPPGFSYSASDGKLDTIRGVRVAEGTIAAVGMEAVPAAGRVVTPRAVEMTEGLFQFAERSHRKDPGRETE